MTPVVSNCTIEKVWQRSSVCNLVPQQVDLVADLSFSCPVSSGFFKVFELVAGMDFSSNLVPGAYSGRIFKFLLEKVAAQVTQVRAKNIFGEKIWRKPQSGSWYNIKLRTLMHF